MFRAKRGVAFRAVVMADIDYGNMGVWEYEPFISYVHSAPLKQQNILHSTFSPRKTSIALHGIMIK